MLIKFCKETAKCIHKMQLWKYGLAEQYSPFPNTYEFDIFFQNLHCISIWITY